jgi:hypothetical protein
MADTAKKDGKSFVVATSDSPVPLPGNVDELKKLCQVILVSRIAIR